MLPNETPIYVLSQNKSRAIIPSAITLIILGIIFYLGVLLNISLLKLNTTNQDIIKLLALILLLFLIVLGTFLSWHQSKQNYIFYRQKLLVRKKEIFYANVMLEPPKRDIWDKLFHTYSLSLGRNVFLRNIPEEINIANYLQQLVNYAKRENYSQ